MANTFKSFQNANVTSNVTIFTGAANTQSTIIGLSAANTTSGPVYVSAKLNGVFLIKEAPVPQGSSLVIVGGDQKVVVEAGDIVSVESTGTADFIMSVLEIS